MTRALDVLRSIVFYAVFYTGSIVFALSGVVGLAIGPRAVRAACDGWSGFHRWCVARLLGIRVILDGVLPEGQYLAVFKHESFFEAIDLPNLLDNPGVFAKAELLRLPLWGKAAAAYGVVAVEREAGAKALRAMVAAARRITGEGRVLAIFPEGTRVPHGAMPALQSGFAGLYKLIGLPVVPIAVDSGLLYHRPFKRRGTIVYRIGETIPPGLPRAEIEARVHAAINALNLEGARFAPTLPG